jgi:hypothetical protein
VSENLQKFVGIAVMAVIVVVGVVATNNDDSDFARTRNNAFGLPKGAGLDAQVQQPGDAENDLVIAMAAAAKCEEGHVLISTGDPVSPWRCGPLLSEMATVAIEDRVSRIELALEANPRLDRSAQALLVALENFAGQRLDDMYAGALADRVVVDSRLLVGVPLETAEQVVRSLGLGFRHAYQDGRRLNPVNDFGIRRDPDGRMAAILVHTRDGVVSLVEPLMSGS